MGIVGGVLLRMADLSPEQVDLLGCLGELMLRLLKMLVLPLVAGSMVAGEPPVPSVLSPEATQADLPHLMLSARLLRYPKCGNVYLHTMLAWSYAK